MTPEVGPSRRIFFPALVGGWLLIAFGAWSALNDSTDAHPFALVVHVVAFNLGHDVIVAPLVFAAIWVVGRLVPSPARGPIRAASAVSAILVSYPLVRRWGQRPTNSSTLPLEYGRNLVVILAGVWVLAGAAVVLRAVRSRPRA